MKVSDLLHTLESCAPKRWAFSFDRVGLQVGDPQAEVRRAVVSLDRSRAAVQFAQETNAQLLLAHHPLIFAPLESVVSTDLVGETILRLIQAKIAFVAAHTNWDSAPGGVNDALLRRLNLCAGGHFGSAAKVGRRKMVVFVPEAAVESVIDAATTAGAGTIGAYRRCAFSHPGTGTFEGDATTRPAVGSPESIERVPEVRIEMVAPAERVQAIKRAVRSVHPYEEPAIDFLLLDDANEQPAGRWAEVTPCSLEELAANVDRQLETHSMVWGDPHRVIHRIAVVGGSADSEWKAAREAGADVLVTGEVKQHVALEAAEAGFALIAAGHYATEQPGVEALADHLRHQHPEVEWQVFKPEPGFAGRPLTR